MSDSHFITIRRKLLSAKSADTSSLEIRGKELVVVGILPHLSTITPASKEDADKLRSWLDANYPTNIPRRLQHILKG